MRRIVLLVLALVLVVGLAATWFFSSYEEVTVKVRTPPEAEARRNRYLALERFFDRMGRPLQRRADVRFLDALPAGGVLLLDSGRRTHLTPERMKRLLAWVEQGGYLIVSPDFPGNDPLMALFDLSRFSGKEKVASNACQSEDAAPKGEDDQTEAELAEKTAALTAACQAMDRRVPVIIPGAARLLFSEVTYQSLQTGKIKPLWQAGRVGQGAQYLHFTQGKGQVTVIAGLTAQFNNNNIGRQDHAEIIWTLVQAYQPQRTGPLSLMTRLEIPTLRQWLAENAQSALIAGLALLLLWLWRVVPRFGPPAPDPEPDRRQLREHLTAIGRYVWRSGGLEHWLAVSRDAFQARLALRHPALSGLPPVEQAEALGRLTLRPVGLIAAALYGPADTVSSFTSAMRTLRNLECTL